MIGQVMTVAASVCLCAIQWQKGIRFEGVMNLVWGDRDRDGNREVYDGPESSMMKDYCTPSVQKSACFHCQASTNEMRQALVNRY